MPLYLYTGNRMENLVQTLAEVLDQPISHPLAPEILVVQSQGMQRWLDMKLAGYFGVWANCRYLFPNALVDDLFCRILPEAPLQDPFDPEVMTWKILRLLPQWIKHPDFTPLKPYLKEDPEGLKRYQLAGRIADVFQQYILFRPDMLRAWESGTVDDWQSVVWRELSREENGRHRGTLAREYIQRLHGLSENPDGFPERITVFGISYLPDHHLEILEATSRITRIHLFCFSPTREYWGDIVSKKAMARMGPQERILRTTGHPLLASLGKLGRDFSERIIAVSESAPVQVDMYVEETGSSLLHRLQSDIFILSGAGPEKTKQSIHPEDRSIRIHSCHSPMREVEILYDQILHLLDSTDGLNPRDIVVMTPDIETYAPYITAVFDATPDSSRRIPYSISDRTPAAENRIASILSKLLALPGSRMTATQLLDILEMTPVRNRFDLSETDLESIRLWLDGTRIRWGVDEESRARMEFPRYREHTWMAGLDRLLLGYAMPIESGRMWNGILPYDEMEGEGPAILGRMAEFVHRTANLSDRLAVARTLGEWREECGRLLADFVLVDDDTAHDAAEVAAALEKITELERSSGFYQTVETVVIRSWLSSWLGQRKKGSGFLTGGVTFCAMLPMRSIPFRVVAMIGMNDGAFPRRMPSAGFDHIARNPRRGDRSLRDEDRYLFLEAILSARDCLYISFVGQSVSDNSPIPPSVVVSELIDAIDSGYTATSHASVESRLIVRHRLQAFHPEYFRKQGTLFSYSEENRAASVRRRDRVLSPSFLETPLSETRDREIDITLTQLLRFFSNPAAFFLENRLGIRLEEIASPPEDREPFRLEGLDAYRLKSELVEAVLNGEDPMTYREIARAAGWLPPARHGDASFSIVVRDVEVFARKVKTEQGDREILPSVDIDLTRENTRLTGRLDRIFSDKMIRYRCATVKPRDLIRVWIEHVVLQVASPDGYPRVTSAVQTDQTKRFDPVENAGEVLDRILDLYRQGWREPLKFFPHSSLAYARDWRLDRAKQVWKTAYDRPGEQENPSFRLCFKNRNPLDSEFERIARQFFDPLLTSMR